MAGGFLHENHTFVSLTPTMLLKMLYKIRPVQDRGLFLVWSLPVAVRSFGQCEYIRTGPGPSLCLQEQKTGPDRTFKHYSSSASDLGSSVPNPTHLPATGMCTSKREVVTMPLSTRKILSRFSVKNSWLCPSALLNS